MSLSEQMAIEEELEDLAKEYHRVQDFLFLGRGVHYPIALEGALKLKEVSYIHAEGYAAGEMKHGPIALIDEGTPIVVVATKSHVYDKVVSNIQEVIARGGDVIAIATEGDGEIERSSALLQIGGRKIHRDPSGRPGIARGANGGTNPFARLADRSVWEPDDPHRWDPRCDIDLHLDGKSADSKKRTGGNGDGHRPMAQHHGL